MRGLPLMLILLGAVALAGAPRPARAAELSDEVDASEEVYAVQPRPLQRRHEFSASIGVLPLDSLYKGLTLGASYTYHFDALVAWQVLHFRYSYNIDTGVTNDLNTRFMVMPTTDSFPPVQWLLDSTVVLKLLSGKGVLGQRTLVGAEVALLLGFAAAVLETGQFVPGVTVGLGLRAHLNRWFTANLEVREYELARLSPSFGVGNVLDLSLGASLNLR